MLVNASLFATSNALGSASLGLLQESPQTDDAASVALLRRTVALAAPETLQLTLYKPQTNTPCRGDFGDRVITSQTPRAVQRYKKKKLPADHVSLNHRDKSSQLLH